MMSWRGYTYDMYLFDVYTDMYNRRYYPSWWNSSCESNYSKSRLYFWWLDRVTLVIAFGFLPHFRRLHRAPVTQNNDVTGRGEQEPPLWNFRIFNFYRPKRSFGQGNIFIPVCHSVHGGRGLPQCMLGYPPARETPPRQADKFAKR